MRVLVCGSRTFQDYEKLKQTLLDYHFGFGQLEKGQIEVIISGEAKGADSLAKRFANTFRFKYEGYPALWGQYGKSAGFKRNKQMLEEGKPDIVFAFWDGVSRGTQNMIQLARSAGVEVRIIEYRKEIEERFV